MQSDPENHVRDVETRVEACRLPQRADRIFVAAQSEVREADLQLGLSAPRLALPSALAPLEEAQLLTQLPGIAASHLLV